MRLSSSIAALALLAALPAFGADTPAPAAPTLRPLDEAALRAAAMPLVARPVMTQVRPASPRNQPWQRWLFPVSADSTDGGYLRLLSHPLFGLLNADVSARDIVYAPGAALTAPAADGAIQLALPQSVGEINLQNIRTGATDNTNFGSIQIKGLDLGRTVITVTPTK
jgi:hypothetical protein